MCFSMKTVRVLFVIGTVLSFLIYSMLGNVNRVSRRSQVSNKIEVEEKTKEAIDFKMSYVNPSTVPQFFPNHPVAPNVIEITLKPKINFTKPSPTFNQECDRQECLNQSEVKWKMHTFVKSRAENINRRQNIRQTWGSVTYVNGAELTTIFVIGKTNEKTQSLLDEESKRFGDILQIDEDDGYQNVPMKVLAGMQWAADNLPETLYYSTCDDDMLVDIGRLQEEVEKTVQKASKEKWPEFPIICGYDSWGDPKGPIRDKRHKNYVSENKYRWSKWPKFCLGGMYTTSVRVVKQLYEISRTKNPINTDDVWITGVLRNILGMPDVMLIKVKPGVATHQDGFGRLNVDQIKTKVLGLWKKQLEKYKSKKICTC